jgi:hypothetical protein
MNKLNSKIDYGNSLDKLQNPFPKNPMLIHKIQDSILSLSGYDLLSMAARNSATKNVKQSIALVCKCLKDNPKLTIEIFGAELLEMIDEYREDNLL